ncbi:MAG: hypothetical protein OXF72_09310 [Gammaproteobacteria bacterium]|nr:hypothetical protein [Gammaproteobacteria bacterium]MCY4200890.1 hypothetical protein [Gammaproteobacteria bacterium]MCY4278207.1 hypothetical protein [Gammaproteobacteria bacterium]
MIQELHANQVVVVSGGARDPDVSGAATSGLAGGVAGFFADRGVQAAAARIGVSAARGALAGGVVGIAVGVAVAVGLEIWSASQD